MKMMNGNKKFKCVYRKYSNHLLEHKKKKTFEKYPNVHCIFMVVIIHIYRRIKKKKYIYRCLYEI